MKDSNVIFVETSRYNGLGDNEREGGDLFAISLVVGFVLFLLII